MKTTCIFLMLGIGFSSPAGTLFDQLCAFNPNWSKYSSRVPVENERVFLSDKQYIQTHLELVLGILKTAGTRNLNQEQLSMRSHLIEVLADYRLQGVFPINYYRAERIPVFIDEHNTHCAVGYLMRESGYGNLARKISQADNYIWVKDLEDEQVIEWQQLSGFSMEELKLIQGAYDSYMPFALEAPNRIEIPQKPEVIALNFKKDDLDQNDRKTGEHKIWIRGEGKEGVLHGRWEQNFSPKLPWIVGFYQHGKREGKWLEYYQGTDQLCRTEHWKNDKLNGIRTRFDRLGNVIEEIEFKDGNAVLKTNYEMGNSLKYIRKPLGENKVWTEIFDLAGNRIATGHEVIHNPGNLQWFQNIELTALNTMALASQSYTETHLTGNGNPGIRLYDEPPLVEYIKQGDWVYYEDVREIRHLKPYLEGMPLNSFLGDRFKNLGGEILPNGIRMETPAFFSQLDSVHVSYSDGNVNCLTGFEKQKQLRMEFEWYSLEGLLNEYGNLSIRHPYWKNQSQIKNFGFLNEQDEKIHKWYHFRENGQLSRVEEFILPEKKEIARKEIDEN